MVSAILESIVSDQKALSVRLCKENSFGLMELILAYGGQCRLVAGGVKNVNAFRYYLLSAFIHKLDNIGPETHVTPGVISDLVHARDALQTFQKNEDPERFRLSFTTAGILIDVIQRLLSEIANRAENEEIHLATFDKEVADEIREGITYFGTCIGQDLEDLPLFCVSEQGNLSTHQLIRGASKKLAPHVTAKITVLIAEEIDEAGKCLAFSRATASGFHILRSVELLILEWIKKGGFPTPDNRNWGAYIKSLRTGNAAKEVTDLLQIIKDNYRNPVIHPEDTLELDEAVSLFQICQSAIEVLCRHIP